MTNTTLAPEQSRALFDILTHHETYAEIEAFKFPGAVTGYGFPFASTTVAPQINSVLQTNPNAGWRSWAGTPANSAPGTPRSRTPVAGFRGSTVDKESTSVEGNDQSVGDDQMSMSPVLQTLLSRIILPLPGVRELPREFWSVRVQGLLARLGEAELSDTYDKGALGTRKVLSTGASGLVEMVGRGAFGGIQRRHDGNQQPKKSGGKKKEYDLSKADDLVRAWDDVVEGLVYGDLVDQSFDHFSKTADLESLSPTVEAAAQYAIIQ